jgi:hypothetical protein
MLPSKELGSNNPNVRNHKQKTFNRVLESEICQHIGFTEDDLEPYWLEFRGMSAKSNVLTIESLQNMLTTLNVISN